MKITFLGILWLLDEMFQKDLLARDVLIDGNMLVYYRADKDSPEGWSSIPIHKAATDLMHNQDSLDYVTSAAKRSGIDTDKCFIKANQLLGLI